MMHEMVNGNSEPVELCRRWMQIRQQWYLSELLGFWTLSIVRNSIYKETRRFGNWICFRPQMRGRDKERERDTHTHILCWVHQKELISITGPDLSKGPNRVCVSPPHLRTEIDPVSEALCFLVFRIPDDGRSPETQWFWVLYIIARIIQILIISLSLPIIIFLMKNGLLKDAMVTLLITRARISMTCHIFILASFHMYN
jgi:hypothetical protein